MHSVEYVKQRLFPPGKFCSNIYMISGGNRQIFESNMYLLASGAIVKCKY